METKTVYLLGHVFVAGLKGELRLEIPITESDIVLSKCGFCVYEDSWERIISIIHSKISKSVSSYSFTGLEINSKVIGRITRDTEELLGVTELKH